MEIRIQLTYPDFRDGFNAHIRRTRPRRWMSYVTRAFCVAMVLLATVVLLLDRSPDVGKQLLPFFAVFPIWVVILFGYIPFAAWQQWKNSPTMAQENIYDFSEDGYSFRGQTSSGNATWANIVQWTESKKVFLLYPTRVIFVPLPKRFFSPQQVGEFRELLARHVKHA